jgi:phage-related holin
MNEKTMINLATFNHSDSIVTTTTKAIVWAGVFISPVKTLMVTTFCLIIVDFITGLWAASKEKQKISSSRMSDTFIKLVLYQLAIIVGYYVEKHMLNFIPIIKIISAFIGLIELKSFFENVSRITGKDNLWKFIRVVLKNKLKSELQITDENYDEIEKAVSGDDGQQKKETPGN